MRVVRIPMEGLGVVNVVLDDLQRRLEHIDVKVARYL